jgi:multiple sugar transport system substrate-binding protein
MLQNGPHVHEKSLVDVSDVVEEILRAQGGFHPVCEMLCRVGGTWRSVPHAITPYLVVYRKSLHDELGISVFPKMWEEWYEVGRTLKGRGFPIGQTVAHTLVDGPAFWYPYLWSWGGKEVGTDGKTVTLDYSAVSESVKFAVAFWRDCCDERGLSWTDTGNGRAYLSGTIASTLSTPSIYLAARDDPGKFRTERDTPLHADIRHAPLPGSGGVGRFSYHRALHHGVMSYSKNPALAKDVLRWLHARETFEPWFVAERGSAIGCTRMWQRHALWTQDPVMLPFRDAARFYRLFGYAGQPSARAAEAVSSHIVVDMYAKAIRGMPADEAVKWAADELRRIYA